MSAIKVYNSNILNVVDAVVVGHYRGEDSGAIYPEFDYVTVESYDLNPIKDHKIGNYTVHELIEKSQRDYPYAGEMFTSPQARTIYSYIQTLDNLSELRRK